MPSCQELPHHRRYFISKGGRFCFLSMSYPWGSRDCPDDMGTTMFSEIPDMLLSREGGINAIICHKLVDSLAGISRGWPAIWAKLSWVKNSPIGLRKQLLFCKFSNFSGNKRWMSETNSDPSSARILGEDSFFNLLLKTFSGLGMKSTKPKDCLLVEYLEVLNDSGVARWT